MQRNILDFIEAHLKSAVSVEKEANEARWKLASNGRPADERRYAEKQDALDQLYGDRENYARILNYDGGDLATSPEVARQLRLLRFLFAKHQMPKSALLRLAEEEVEVERIVADHRILIDDQELSATEASKILRTSDDRDQRKEIWESKLSIGDELGPLLLRVVGIRNRAARELEYRNFYRLNLELNEIDETQLLLTLEETLKVTDEPYRILKSRLDRETAKRFHTTQKRLRPWHYGEPIFAGAPDPNGLDFDRFYGRKSVVRIAETFFKGIGFDLDPVVAKSDLAAREGKSAREFCLHIDRNGRDVRIFANIGTGYAAMQKALRQLGAASYYRNLGKKLDFVVRQPAHNLLVEAVSMLMERNAEDPEFLKELVKAHKATVTKSVAAIEQERRDAMLMFARWNCVLIFFERALYEHPGQDLNRTWWMLLDHILHITPPEGREMRHDWAAHLPFASNPLSSYHQLFGQLIASQLRAAIMREQDSASMVDNESFGSFLREQLFSLGAKHHWAETLVKVTGERLSAQAFAAEYLQS